MTEYLYLDIETRSGADLKKTGVYRYAEDEQFDILMLAWAWNDDPMQTSTNSDEIRGVIRDILERHERGEDFKVIAHNTGFERVCFSSYIGMPVGSYIDPEVFEDTMVLAAEWGLPLSLKDLAKWLGGELKDEAGSALIRFFCTPKKDGSFRSPEDDPEKWEAFVAYCAQDVEAMRDVHKKLRGFPTEDEREIWLVDQRMNDRGLDIDVEFAKAAVAASEANKERDLGRMGEITGLPNPNSVAQLKSWLIEKGYEVDSLNKASVEDLLAKPDLDPEAREVLELRQSVALSSGAKYTSALNAVCSDGRLRGTLFFGGAHTMRWAGRIFQPQNLPGAKLPKEDWKIEAAIMDVKMGEPTTQAELKSLIRPMIKGPIIACDLSQIEARVLGWLADERTVLDAYRAGKDLYSVTAAEMYDTPYEEVVSDPQETLRKKGKVAVLALGYGGGANALKAFGAPGTDDELWEQVNLYREANESIVQFWRDMERAFIEGGKAGRVEFTKDGSDRYLHLPSGRCIVYRNCTKKMVTDKNGRERRQLFRKDPRAKGFPTSVYGGRIAENVTQAVARDFIASSMVGMDKVGYNLLTSVHDEVLVEGGRESDLIEVGNIMTTLPRWASDFPLDCDGGIMARYVKRKGTHTFQPGGKWQLVKDED